MVAPKLLAGNVRAQSDRRTGGEVNKIEGIGVGLGEAWLLGDPALQGGLNRWIVDQRPGSRAQRLAADQFSVTNR